MKKGQFYIVAAFVIVLIMSGLTYIYTRADSPAENIDLKGLAKEIDFETNYAINSAVLEGLNDNIITARIKEIGNYYLDRYPFLDLIMVYGDNKNAYIIWTGDEVNICHVESDKSPEEKSVQRSALKGLSLIHI